MVGDAVEARLYNNLYPYRGLMRFAFDLAVAGCFLIAFVAAASHSVFFLGAMAGTFFFGGLWAWKLGREHNDVLHYPALTVVTHFAAALIASSACAAFLVSGVYTLDTRAEFVVLFGGYVVWSIGGEALKEAFKIDHCRVELLPTGIFDIAVKWVFDYIRRKGNQLDDQPKPGPAPRPPEMSEAAGEEEQV